MKRTVSATEARIHFGELMRQATETHEPIIVERDGKSHIVILSIAAYERLLKGHRPENWRELVKRTHAQVRAELDGRALPPPEDVLRQAREEEYAT